MDSDTALNTLKNSLITNLTDVYVTAGGNTRSQWIYYNEPISSPKYPIIELTKLTNPEIVLDIGPNFAVSEVVIANLWVYSKNGFNVNIAGTEYLNSRLVEWLFVQIKNIIKTQFSSLFSSGIICRTLNTSRIEYDPNTQLFFGAVSVKIWFFKL
jgi:hypothetical protein